MDETTLFGHKLLRSQSTVFSPAGETVTTDMLYIENTNFTTSNNTSVKYMHS